MQRARALANRLAEGHWRSPFAATRSHATAQPLAPVPEPTATPPPVTLGWVVAEPCPDDDQGPRLAEGWQLVCGASPEQTCLLSAAEAEQLLGQDKPLILLVGDGHRSVPFSYAKGYPAVARHAARRQVHLYVEFSEAGWAAHCAKRAASALPPWLVAAGAEVVAWEPPVCEYVMVLVEHAFALSCAYPLPPAVAQRRSELIALTKVCAEAFSEYAPALAKRLHSTVSALLVPEHEAAQAALTALRTILTVSWRDEYINPYLAERVARHAARCPNDLFLVSVGGAHLAWSYGPVQQHLARLRQEEGAFSHALLCHEGQSLR